MVQSLVRLVAEGITLSFVLWLAPKLYKLFVSPYFSNSVAYKLHGPKAASRVLGYYKEMWKPAKETVFNKLVKQYGTTFSYTGLFNRRVVFTVDLKAVNHMITHSNIYQKPLFAREMLARSLGNGVLLVEGEDHRKQRRVLNPSFGIAQIRDLTEIFVNKSDELCDYWRNQLSPVSGSGTIDVMDGLSKATLDIIGLAGFDYAFNSMRAGDPNELNVALHTALHSGASFNWTFFLQNMISFLRWVPDKRMSQMHHAKRTMDRIGRELLEEKKAAVRRSVGVAVEKSAIVGRDLLSQLVRANMAIDLPDSQRLSDEEVLAQIPTFLLAGHETTSLSTTYALFELASRPELQTALRAELSGVPAQHDMDTLNALPLLDAVVRETMRVHGPVQLVERAVDADDVLPLTQPVTDNQGIVHDHLEMRHGDLITIGVYEINHSTDLWGPDADEFRPERWLDPGTLPMAATDVPGVWSNLMTFLGGPRVCIGWRFALVEMKALLCAIVRNFELDLAVPREDVYKTFGDIVTRPVIGSALEKNHHLPVTLRPVKA